MVLHAAIFCAGSLATPLRDMLHESLQRVTPLATVKIDAKLAATNVAESRIGFYFSQRLQQLFFSIAACNTPFAASLAMLWFYNSSTHAQQPSGETTKMADALNEVEDDETMTESQEYGRDESTKLSDTDKKKLIEALKHHPCLWDSTVPQDKQKKLD